MSALIFVLKEEEIFLATDTVFLSANTKDPFIFTTKMYFLPHMGLVMVGMGLANTVAEWFLRLNSTLLARDMDDVDRFAPDMLREYLSPQRLSTVFTQER